MSDRIRDDRKDKQYKWAIAAFFGDVLGGMVGLVAANFKRHKIHKRMMPECVVAEAAAPGSSFGGGGVAEAQEKFNCFAGIGFTVAFSAAIFMNVVAHCCISCLAGFCRNWSCEGRDDTSEDRYQRRWVVGLHWTTLVLVVIGSVLIGAGGVPKYAKEPNICLPNNNNNNTTTTVIYDVPRETRVCSVAWLPIAGGITVLIHGIAGLFYALYALGIATPPGSSRR